MTSKAERKRRHRAAQKIRHLRRQEEDALDELYASRSTPLPVVADEVPAGRGGIMTEKQEAAWAWFRALWRGQPGGPAAQKELKQIRLQITDDEYDILCELCRDSMRIPLRVGRSRQKVRELWLSALRKLVVYRFTSGGGEVTT